MQKYFVIMLQNKRLLSVLILDFKVIWNANRENTISFNKMHLTWAFFNKSIILKISTWKCWVFPETAEQKFYWIKMQKTYIFVVKPE